MNWSDEKTISFIKMYYDRPMLWNSRDLQYKNKNKRHDGLVQIADYFGVEKQEVEKKIKNLQSQFAREKKKEKESRKSGIGADEAYTSKWFAYKPLMFLADKNKATNIQDTEHSKHLDEEDSERQKENNITENLENMETTNAEDIAIAGTSKRTFISPKKPTKKCKLNSAAANVPIMDEAINLLRAIQSKKSDKDEYTLYGEQVAIKLRNLTSPQVRFRAQQIINNALFEAEMSCFSYTSQPIFQGQANLQSSTNYLLSHSRNLATPHSSTSNASQNTPSPITPRSETSFNENQFEDQFSLSFNNSIINLPK